MIDKNINYLISNCSIKDLMKLPKEDKNIILSLERLTHEKIWCYQNGCTTCGALGLRANIVFFAIQKCKEYLDLDFLIEKNLRWLFLFRTPSDVKNKLVKVLCNELNNLTEEEIQRCNPEILRFIVLEIWRALDKSTFRLLEMTLKNPINLFIEEMNSHYRKI